jgi:hypothetical protein
MVTSRILAGLAAVLAGSGAWQTARCQTSYAGLYVVALPDVSGHKQAAALAAAYQLPFIDGVMIPLHYPPRRGAMERLVASRNTKACWRTELRRSREAGCKHPSSRYGRRMC